MILRILICAYIPIMGLISPGILVAQHDLSLYNFKMVPERIQQNPAFIPQEKVYFGIPFLSGVQAAFANPFSYVDVIERDEYDSVTLRIDNFMTKISRNDHMRFYTNLDLISVGFQLAKGRFFLGFSIRERFSQHITIPRNLCYMLWYGNTAPQLFGKYVNISPSVDALVYDEWAVSFSGYALDQKLSLGGRLKYLSGRINVRTKRSQVDFYTDTATYRIHISSDFEIQTSGIYDFEKYFEQAVPSLIFPGNHGVGVDVGFNYQISNSFSINASILDFGFINWQTNTMSLVSQNPGEEFIYDGLNLNDFMAISDDLDSFGKMVTDSILDLAHIDSVFDEPYVSWLPVRYNLGGSYSINDQHYFNLLLNGISWNHQFFPALSLAYYYSYKKFLGIMVSYNIFNNQYTNIGGGIGITGGPVQLYILSDNILGFFSYRKTNNSSIQFGINISLNR
ncbi:MAG: hypothetical protein HQ542_11260 [Bacteroidia bacterium]|nr:hypothetical protein [Bacteroidia bacterium]